MGAYRKFSAVDKASSKTYQIQIVIGGRVVYCSWSAAWMSEFNYSCYCYLLPVFSVARGWFLHRLWLFVVWCVAAVELWWQVGVFPVPVGCWRHQLSAADKLRVKRYSLLRHQRSLPPRCPPYLLGARFGAVPVQKSPRSERHRGDDNADETDHAELRHDENYRSWRHWVVIWWRHLANWNTIRYDTTRYDRWLALENWQASCQFNLAHELRMYINLCWVTSCDVVNYCD